MIFSCVGPYAKSRIYRTEQKDAVNDLIDDKIDAIKFRRKPDASVVMSGEFPLKSLNNFIKCTPLCQHLEIYLENSLPLIVKYDIGSNMGDIRLCLSPLPPLNND